MHQNIQDLLSEVARSTEQGIQVTSTAEQVLTTASIYAGLRAKAEDRPESVQLTTTCLFLSLMDYSLDSSAESVSLRAFAAAFYTDNFVSIFDGLKKDYFGSFGGDANIYSNLSPLFEAKLSTNMTLIMQSAAHKATRDQQEKVTEEHLIRALFENSDSGLYARLSSNYSFPLRKIYKRFESLLVNAEQAQDNASTEQTTEVPSTETEVSSDALDFNIEQMSVCAGKALKYAEGLRQQLQHPEIRLSHLFLGILKASESAIRTKELFASAGSNGTDSDTITDNQILPLLSDFPSEDFELNYQAIDLQEEPSLAEHTRQALEHAKQYSDGDNSKVIHNTALLKGVLTVKESETVRIIDTHFPKLSTELGLEVVSIVSRPEVEVAEALSCYLSDMAATKDDLDMQTDVDNLSQLIMAKKWKPPLSIGLFGDWGTGKSSFIKLLQQSIEAKASASQLLEQQMAQKKEGSGRKNGNSEDSSAFVENVIQIEFNAWHYLDANLWASMIIHLLKGISDQVFERSLEPEDLEREEQQKRLYSELEITRNSSMSLKDERNKIDQNIKALINQQIDLEEQKKNSLPFVFEQLLDQGLTEAKAYLNANEGEDSAAHGLNQTLGDLNIVYEDLSDGYDQLIEVKQDVKTVFSFLQTLVSKMAENKKTLYAVLVLVVFISLPFSAFEQYAPFLTDAFKTVSAILASVVTFLLSARNIIHPAWEKFRQKAAQIRKAEKEFEQLIKKRKRAIEQQEEEHRKTLIKINQNIEYEEKKRANIEYQLQQIKAGIGLEEFLLQRVGRKEYQEQLGIIAMVHADLKTLQKKLHKEGYDRVILYIDDLDRCPPDRVVDVLQAVHLLLGIPLFVVVVAVDSRWLLRSLELHYSHMLDKHDAIAGNWESSPQNYLEKIFQIPFSLRPLEEHNYSKFINTLFAADEKSVADKERDIINNRDKFHQQVKRELEAEKELTAAKNTLANQQQQQQESHSKGSKGKSIEVDTFQEEVNAWESKLRTIRLEKTNQIKSWQADRDYNPPNLNISEQEVSFFTTLYPLLSTPRVIKRLINIYRLIRVGLSANELKRLENGEYQVVQILLAIMFGKNTCAPSVFLQLKNREDIEQFDTLIRELTPQLIDDQLSNCVGELDQKQADVWQRFCLSVEQIEIEQQDMALYQKWAPVVGRYSFQVSRVMA